MTISRCEFSHRRLVALLVLGLLLCGSAATTQAQTTYTWANPGVNSDVTNGANWVGGVAPPFTSSADSAIYSASTNTVVNVPDALAGTVWTNVTFDASAPAYSFTATTPTIDHDMGIGNAGVMLNQSNNTQDFSNLFDVYFSSTTLDASGGNPTTHLGYNMSTILYSGAAVVRGSFDTKAVAIQGLSAGQTLTKQGSGTLFVTGNDNTIVGRLAIGSSGTTLAGPMGAVRISTDNGLGAGGSTSANYTRIYGNINSDGRLELTNNITTNEGIILYGRLNGNGTGTITYDNSFNPAIVNVSGNNTMTGPFNIQGGAAYNFASTSGSLTVTSDINWNLTGDRFLTTQGAGNITFSGSLSNGHTTGGNPDGDVSIEQLGSGTLTLAGVANANFGNVIISAGTLAVGANATFSFRPNTDYGFVPQVFIQNNATFDVSAVAGGFTLSQPLQGTGNVVGDLHMGIGTQVIPGGGPAYQSDQLWNANGINYGVGQLHFHNGLDLSQGSQMVWHLGALSTTGPGTNFDQLQVDGALTLGGSSSLSIDLSLLAGGSQPGGGDPFWNTSHTWTIITNSNNPGSSNFTSLLNNVVATGTFSTSVSTGSLLGDVNGDHVVNGLDIAVVASHWLLTGATLGQGDANGDGTVNGLDIALIASHWLSTGGTGGGIVLTYTPSAGGGTAVPEPSTVALATIGLASIAGIRRFRRK